jgi:hypothetical protein
MLMPIGLLLAATAQAAAPPNLLPPLKNCSAYPKNSHCACDDRKKNPPGVCFACPDCASCFGCGSCVHCRNGDAPLPPPPPPRAPPPAPWAPRVAAAQLLAAESDPEYAGLFPSVRPPSARLAMGGRAMQTPLSIYFDFFYKDS